ncbi:MAG: peptide chain release factor N(5)-glutamine methyltransferase [Dehalococcoidia bacterium]|nr:peptide chain release factor N(5)-glutamine methyltransferase [Dehalococcoidia bacterium]MSQ16461.1 peptide chain release factor N(5)-glutamine methyltransferase [Dehalococcoidia bacterium]
MSNLRQIVQQTHRALEAAGIPDARLEAEVAVMNVVRIPRQDLFARQEAEVSPQQERDLAQLMERRLKREPLAYILGRREFYGINLLVNPNVLIPRPETESLVEHALFMALMGMDTPSLVIADVGTGTGAIAINLALHLPRARIFAIDRSDAALDVASYNIRGHNVADRVTLLQGDLLEPLPEPVDLIVANLPYLPTARIATLQPEIQWEPRLALDGGADGLDPIRRLLAQAAGGKLKEIGGILLELDPEQVPAVQALARQLFPEAQTSVEQDLARQDRMFVINRGLG